MNTLRAWVVAALLPVLVATVAVPADAVADEPAATGLKGHLLLIGGGLDDDNADVYGRFIELAKAAAKPEERNSPRIVIATAASFNQDAAAKGKLETIPLYCPGAKLSVITRETPREETVALIDAASAMFFTGGDQKRIVDRYRPGGVDTPEIEAMRRLLARDGVIAGTSAGDAMMGNIMFHTGRSAEALGIRSTREEAGPDDDADEKRPEIPLGPQIGPGMAFLPWAIADSHFFERNRFGRLVAALEESDIRLGIGVGEDACAEVDLETGFVSGVSVADSLLVDTGAVHREGLARKRVLAKVIKKGVREKISDAEQRAVPEATPRPGTFEEIVVTEPGQNRQLASWRFFTRAETPGSPGCVLKLDGYDQFAWPDGKGWAVVEIVPQSSEVPAAETPAAR